MTNVSSSPPRCTPRVRSRMKKPIKNVQKNMRAASSLFCFLQIPVVYVRRGKHIVSRTMNIDKRGVSRPVSTPMKNSLLRFPKDSFLPSPTLTKAACSYDNNLVPLRRTQDNLTRKNGEVPEPFDSARVHGTPTRRGSCRSQQSKKSQVSEAL